MENNNNTSAPRYSVTLSQKQIEWVIDKNTQLKSLEDLLNKKLIQHVDSKQLCVQMSTLLEMIIRSGEWKTE